MIAAAGVRRAPATKRAFTKSNAMTRLAPRCAIRRTVQSLRPPTNIGVSTHARVVVRMGGRALAARRMNNQRLTNDAVNATTDDWCPTCACNEPCSHNVDCDNATCKAVCTPTTRAEFKDAYEHWRFHGRASGCSHGWACVGGPPHERMTP